nr:hypothetical protein [Paenibacillus xylanexedens]
MHYLDKQEAKVNIMYKLVDAGWEVFGYKQDESDSMVDYYSPASWSGVATKNGYVLLVDVCKYNLSDSGREVRKYDYNKQSYSANSRIEKLTAMMNDAASTENEKASCAVLIEKEMEKSNVEPSYTVIETYPTFAFGNPKGASWHIEKDGQIIAKGNGVYATNTYDWENKEKSAKQQKEEKITSLIKRIEKALTDADALRPEIVKVPVKTIQAVEKSVSEITESDIKEGLTFVMKVGYTRGASKGNKYTLTHIDQQFNKYHTFAKLGKNNKPSKSMDKSWSLSVARFNELLSKGHIAVIEFVEVTEYVEKTVYKKTARKQTVSNVPAIEAIQQSESNVETVNENGNQDTNIKDYICTQEEKIMSNEETVSNIETLEDIFSKFDDIEISNDQRISDDDYKFCQEQETNYKALLMVYEGFYDELNKISHGSFHGVMSSYDYKNSQLKIKESFINNICRYFKDKYKVTIDSEKIINKLNFESGFQDVLDNIFTQLEGYSFNEKAEKEIKDNSREMFKYGDKILIKGSKLVLDGYFAHLDSIWKEYRLSEDRVRKIFVSLQLFDSGSIMENEELKNKYCGYDNSKKLENYERYTSQTLKKVKSIKFFKNGKLEIEFIGNQEAARFASEYCGYKKIAV